MTSKTLTLERSTGSGPEAKTRVFSVQLLGYLRADRLWACPVSGKAIRPAWIAYLATPQATQPFTANFRCGTPATLGVTRTFEIPSSGTYRWTTQEVPGGVVTVAYLPELFELEAFDAAPERVRFVFAPPRWWVEREARALRQEFGSEAREVARAALLTAYLDRRSPMPLLRDLDFQLALYRAALETPWVSHLDNSLDSQSPLRGRGIEACQLDTPLAVSVPQATLKDFLTEQIHAYRPRALKSRALRSRTAPTDQDQALRPDKETSHGTTRIPSAGRLLPRPEAPPAQLRLGLEMA